MVSTDTLLDDVLDVEYVNELSLGVAVGLVMGIMGVMGIVIVGKFNLSTLSW
jgi:hypothetical protein